MDMEQTTNTEIEMPVQESIICEALGVEASYLRNLRKKRTLVKSWRKIGKKIFYWPSILTKEMYENGDSFPNVS